MEEDRIPLPPYFVVEASVTREFYSNVVEKIKKASMQLPDQKEDAPIEETSKLIAQKTGYPWKTVHAIMMLYVFHERRRGLPMGWKEFHLLSLEYYDKDGQKKSAFYMAVRQ